MWKRPYFDFGHGTTRNCSIRHTCRPAFSPQPVHCGSPFAAASLHFLSMSLPIRLTLVSCQSGWRSLIMVERPRVAQTDGGRGRRGHV